MCLLLSKLSSSGCWSTELASEPHSKNPHSSSQAIQLCTSSIVWYPPDSEFYKIIHCSFWTILCTILPHTLPWTLNFLVFLHPQRNQIFSSICSGYNCCRLHALTIDGWASAICCDHAHICGCITRCFLCKASKMLFLHFLLLELFALWSKTRGSCFSKTVLPFGLWCEVMRKRCFSSFRLSRFFLSFRALCEQFCWCSTINLHLKREQ